jgi:hypothetical protein
MPPWMVTTRFPSEQVADALHEVVQGVAVLGEHHQLLVR